MPTKVQYTQEITAGQLLKKLIQKRVGGTPTVKKGDCYDNTWDVPAFDDDDYEKIAEDFIAALKGQVQKPDLTSLEEGNRGLS